MASLYESLGPQRTFGIIGLGCGTLIAVVPIWCLFAYGSEWMQGAVGQHSSHYLHEFMMTVVLGSLGAGVLVALGSLYFGLRSPKKKYADTQASQPAELPSVKQVPGLGSQIAAGTALPVVGFVLAFIGCAISMESTRNDLLQGVGCLGSIAIGGGLAIKGLLLPRRFR